MEPTKDQSKAQVDSESQALFEKLKVLLGQVSSEAGKANRSIFTKEDEIRDECCRLKIRVDAQGEMMIEEIRKWSCVMKEKIDKYEKELLDKFDADEFETSILGLKSVLADVKNQQEKIEQLLDQSESDVQTMKHLIKETTTKLQELKGEQMIVQSKKFSHKTREVTMGTKRKFNPFKFVNFNQSNSISYDLRDVRTISDMPGFKELKYCFINSYADSYELIALVRNKSDKISFIKMDPDGKVLCEKVSDLSGLCGKVVTVKGCFFMWDYNQNKCRRFDYDFNEFKLPEIPSNETILGLTANQRFVIFETCKKEDRYGSRPRNIYIAELDSSTLPKSYQVDHFNNMLANDKLLFILDESRVRIYDIENLENELPLVRNIEFSCNGTQQRKLLGDKYIAYFDISSVSVKLFTQDSKFELIGEFGLTHLNNEHYFYISTDRSDFFCFFSSKGHIRHNLI